ncbi:MurR/RpiR family transcriptional regulator [Oryzibacter oryziterrae]|uniref:MurR/RpiR family transcriptional regulator n=1 Tax=Oryzibacter oryziterrae TaxID=2766474 RepID=UPI001F1EEE88|nr:MurR/RpiR family transcriptional regulator [Oryzibacter oryziterrae]
MGADDITIAERIRAQLHRFTPTERRAAHSLLANYPVAGLETVAEFARRATVSAPTILRFVGRLGYSNYPEFQRALRDELDKQGQSPLAKSSYGGAEPDGSGPNAAFCGALIDNLQTTFSHISEPEFHTVANLLGDRHRRVGVIGGRMSDALARLFAAHLAVVRPGVMHLDGQPSNWRDLMVDYGPRDIVVVFDIRRYQEDLTALAEIAAGRGATIILLTDQWLSPVSRHARHIFSARIEVPSRWDSMTSLLGIAEALLAAVTEGRWEEASRRIAMIDSFRRLP